LTDSTSYVLKVSLIFQDKFAGQASALYSKVALPIFLKKFSQYIDFLHNPSRPCRRHPKEGQDPLEKRNLCGSMSLNSLGAFIRHFCAAFSHCLGNLSLAGPGCMNTFKEIKSQGSD
jgi:hypothetical protein